MTNIAVIGGGYVGLTTAACLAELGNRVTVVENNPEKLDQLNAGISTILEPGLDDLLKNGLQSGHLRFTGTYGEAVPTASIVFIAVNTPVGANGRADISFVTGALQSVLAYLAPGTILVLKSTVPPGTADSIAVRLEGAGVPVISNPEFLRQGSAVHDFLEPDRIVIGTPSTAEAAPLGKLYQPLNAPVIVCSRRSAELAKYAANSFLAMRISFMNEIAGICDSMGADVEEVAAVMGPDARIGPAFLRAGLGWGGSCFPKDVLALAAAADDRGAPHAILDSVYEANNRQRERAFEYLASALDYRRDPTVAVLGLAFKPGTDDVRGSPALEVIGRLLEAGYRVRAHDPAATANAARALPNITYCSDAYDAAAGSHALLLATEWPEYLALDWREVRRRMRGDLIVDGRNALEAEHLQALGFVYRGFGRAVTSPPTQTGAALRSRREIHRGHSVVGGVATKERPP